MKNPNTFNLGFEAWNETSDEQERILQKARSDFDFVLIVDHMEESLLLLKDELCWDMQGRNL